MSDESRQRSIDQVSVTIPFEKKNLSCKLSRPSQCNGVGFIITHGAGGDMDTEQIVTVSEALAAAGYLVIRFTCRGGSIDYRIRAYISVLRYFKENHGEEIQSCYLAGRSMGARAAVGCANSIVDNDELQSFTKGIICLAYPLHPEKQHDKCRDQPLHQLKYPILFISGNKDSMCDVPLMEQTISRMDNSCEQRIEWIKGGNHSHAVKGRNKEEVGREICDICIRWLTTLASCQRVIEVKVAIKQATKRSNNGSRKRHLNEKL